MKTKLLSLIKYTFLIYGVMYSFTASAIYMPMPIPIYNYGGGNVDPKLFIAMYLVLNAICLIALAVRYIIIQKNEYFEKQSKIKNIFYELNEYYIIKPDLNAWSLFIIMINVLGASVVTINYIASII